MGQLFVVLKQVYDQLDEELLHLYQVKPVVIAHILTFGMAKKQTFAVPNVFIFEDVLYGERYGTVRKRGTCSKYSHCLVFALSLGKLIFFNDFSIFDSSSHS